MAVSWRGCCRLVMVSVIVGTMILVVAFCACYSRILFRPMFHHVFVEPKMSPFRVWKSTMPVTDSSGMLMYCDFKYNMVVVFGSKGSGTSIAVNPHGAGISTATLLQGSDQEVVVDRRDDTLQVFRDGQLLCAVPLKVDAAQSWSQRMTHLLNENGSVGEASEIRQNLPVWYSGPDRDKLEDALAELQE